MRTEECQSAVESNINPFNSAMANYPANDDKESSIIDLVPGPGLKDEDLITLTGRIKKARGSSASWLFQVKTGSADSQPYWLRQPKLLKVYGALGAMLLERFDNVYPREKETDVFDVNFPPSRPISAITAYLPTRLASEVSAMTFARYNRSLPTFVHARRYKVQGAGHSWQLFTEYTGKHSCNGWEHEKELHNLYGNSADEFIQHIDKTYSKAQQKSENIEHLYFDVPFKV